MGTSEDVIMSDASPPQVANEKREGSPLEGSADKRRKAAAELTWEQLQKKNRTGNLNAEELSRWIEEDKKDERLQHPWWDETDSALDQPPDINYRRVILDDQEQIDRLLAEHDMHFEERCMTYRTYDLELEQTLLVEYTDWCENMTVAANKDEGRKTFFSELKESLGHDASLVLDELRVSGHEVEMLRTRDATKDGSQRFFHCWIKCWYYFDEQHQEWLAEPSEKGLLYEERLQEWREEALSKTPESYFDFAENRFYSYNRGQDHWNIEGPTFRPHDGCDFEYDRKTRQWRPSEIILHFRIRHPVESQESSEARTYQEEARPNEPDDEGHYTTTEDRASPSSSVDLQAELDAQLASNMHEA